MSGEITSSQRSKYKADSGNQYNGMFQPPKEQRTYRSKGHRTKTPQIVRNDRSYYQISSPDSDNEIFIDGEQSFVPRQPRTEKRGRSKKRHGKTRSRSRGRSLEDSLSEQQHPLPTPKPRTSYANDSTIKSTASAQDQWPTKYQTQRIDSSLPQFEQRFNSNHQRAATEPTFIVQGGNQQHSEENELVELRMRADQMEKTLRWWSDCTANWREKWTKVRAERNRARDEIKQMKIEQEQTDKELEVLKEQKMLLIDENTKLRHEVSQNNIKLSEDNSSLETPRDSENSSLGTLKPYKNDGLPYSKSTITKRSSTPMLYGNTGLDEDQIAHKLATLQLKIEESAKTIQAERDSKLTLNKTIETLEQELSALKQKHDELKDSKQEIQKQVTRIQEAHRSEILRLTQNLEEEMENRSKSEKKIHDLREEIERLQEENTCEWGKRERLETEKLQLERDNKRLKSVIEELKIALEKRRKSNVEERDNELRLAQTELNDLNEELNDLRREYSRDQKLLEERQEELSHSRRRSEQHEAEVRLLRTRVEEIKKQQTSTEDELDNCQNQGRKLIRVVEEKDEEIEKMHLQLDQLQTRMRRDPSTTTWPKPMFKRGSAVRHDNDSNLSSSESSCEV